MSRLLGWLLHLTLQQKRNNAEYWRAGCSFFFLLNEALRDTHYDGGYPCAVLPRHPFISPFFPLHSTIEITHAAWRTYDITWYHTHEKGSGCVCSKMSWRHNAWSERFKGSVANVKKRSFLEERGTLVSKTEVVAFSLWYATRKVYIHRQKADTCISTFEATECWICCVTLHNHHRISLCGPFAFAL